MINFRNLYYAKVFYIVGIVNYFYLNLFKHIITLYRYKYNHYNLVEKYVLFILRFNALTT